MSDPNQDHRHRRRNRQPSSHSNRPRHAQGYGQPNPLAGFYDPFETPRSPQSGIQQPVLESSSQYHDFAQDSNYPNYTHVPGRSPYDPGVPARNGYIEDHSGAGYHHSRQLPPRGMNQQYNSGEQYEQYGRDPYYEYDQQHERDPRIERAWRYGHSQRVDNNPQSEHGPQYEDDERYVDDEDAGDYENDEEGDMTGAVEPSPADHQQRASRPPIRPGHPGSVSTQGELDPRYVVQRLDYFRAGKVFSILWHENDGRSTTATHVSVGPLFRGKYGEAIYSTIRRMVVVRAFDHYSWCLSISTYGGRGVAKPGVDPAKHTIVHMSDAEPRLGSNEPLMVKEPLMVDPTRFDERLHPKSRLNFGKIYTVEHNVKVLPIGKISEVSMPKLMSYARAEMTI